MVFSPAKPLRTFEVIVAQVREAIASGRIGAGDRLPTQRELAEQFSVSRNGVLQALRILERMGVIEIRSGRLGGAFVRSSDGHQVRDHLELLLEMDRISVPEMVEFRQLVEGQNAFWAAERGTAAEKQEIRKVVQRIHELETDPTGDAWSLILGHDALFHATVARAAHNRVTSAVMDGLLAALNRQLQSVDRNDGAKVYADLNGIGKAIVGGDSVRARHLMSDHIGEFYSLRAGREAGINTEGGTE